MNHPDFIVWLLAYPLMVAAVAFIEAKTHGPRVKDDMAMAKVGAFHLCVWLGVAALLF